MDLLVDLYIDHARLGPGSEATTRQAMSLAGLDRSRRLRIADIGCGTGASSLVLAEGLDADIVCIDLVPPFLNRLQERATQHGVADSITSMAAAMEDLPLDDGAFDVIWSEGAIYNMGFEAGVRAWRRLLAPGGVLVASELIWLTASRPARIDKYWRSEYPQIDLASAKMGILERAGYSPSGYFAVPTRCWREEYYAPILAGLDRFCARHPDNPNAQEIAEAERQEAALYEEFSDFYGYGMYVATLAD